MGVERSRPRPALQQHGGHAVGRGRERGCGQQPLVVEGRGQRGGIAPVPYEVGAHGVAAVHAPRRGSARPGRHCHDGRTGRGPTGEVWRRGVRPCHHGRTGCVRPRRCTPPSGLLGRGVQVGAAHARSPSGTLRQTGRGHQPTPVGEPLGNPAPGRAVGAVERGRTRRHHRAQSQPHHQHGPGLARPDGGHRRLHCGQSAGLAPVHHQPAHGDRPSSGQHDRPGRIGAAGPHRVGAPHYHLVEHPRVEPGPLQRLAAHRAGQLHRVPSGQFAVHRPHRRPGHRQHSHRRHCRSRAHGMNV